MACSPPREEKGTGSYSPGKASKARCREEKQIRDEIPSQEAAIYELMRRQIGFVPQPCSIPQLASFRNLEGQAETDTSQPIRRPIVTRTPFP